MIHTVICLTLIGMVLLNRGKGTDMGSGLGGGASQTLFGSRGSASFLVKLTAGLAAAFFVTSLVLSYLAGQQSKHNASMDILPDETTINIPVGIDE